MGAGELLTRTLPLDVDYTGPRTPDDTDLALLRRVAERDELALGELYDRWSAQVYALAFRLLNDADEAEDVVEETFWRVWRYAGRFSQARGKVGSWVLVLARSQALDRLRTRRRIREDRWDELPEPAFESTLTPRANNPLTHTESAEQREIIERALGELPAEQRQVVEMSFFQGLSQSQIAADTGQPLGTIKTRVRLAMRKLREHLSWLREGGT